MPLKISPRDVLIYLNELGYNNINAQQLKEFIQDLKKLIKYEERKRLNDDESTSDELSRLAQEHDIFSILYSQGTCASRAKIVPKKESVISLQIKKNNKCSHQCKKHSKENVIENETTTATKPIEDKPQKEETDEKQTTSKTSISKKLTCKSSFIRPSIPVNMKSDPVALYHQYQAGWKKHKVPGEDNRAELRWAIREKMSRGPSITRV